MSLKHVYLKLTEAEADIVLGSLGALQQAYDFIGTAMKPSQQVRKDLITADRVKRKIYDRIGLVKKTKSQLPSGAVPKGGKSVGVPLVHRGDPT